MIGLRLTGPLIPSSERFFMRTWTPTSQQEAVFGHFFSSREDLIVDAAAGAGKSSTMFEAVIGSRDPSTLICAFNKEIQLAMEGKLQEAWSAGRVSGRRTITVKTLHSLGLSLLREQWRGGIEVVFNVGDQITKDVFKGSGRLRFHISKVVRYCKDVHPRIHEHPDGAILAASAARHQIRDMRILSNPESLMEIGEAVVSVMKASVERRREVDYADMVWLPLMHGLVPKGKYLRVVVDEAQDLSEGQFELLERYLAPQGSSLVVVGDLNQGVYEFRGADGYMIWEKMKQRGAKKLPLTVSFRCAQRIIEEAQRIVPSIEYRDNAPPGLVDNITIAGMLDKIRPGDFVLSRTNADLVTLAVRAWLTNKQVNIKGGKELLDPIMSIMDRLTLTSLAAFGNSLGQWHAEQTKAAEQADSSWSDLIDDWHQLIHQVGHLVGPDRLEAVLRGIFDQPVKPVWSIEDSESICFSTVHRVKGLEADRVFLLEYSFKQHRGIPPEKITREEWNIEYVAITRAREELYWVQRDPDTAPATSAKQNGKS